MAEETVPCGKKRKKRSFIQTQKRFAKRGNYGRGTQLSQDVYDYFINIMKVMNSKKDDEDEMRVLASNILQEMEGKESEYCCNQIISRVVESLLPHSTDEDFCLFIEKFGQNLRPIFSDPFGSHVLQQTLTVSLARYLKRDSKTCDSKVTVHVFDYIMKVSNFLFNNLDDFIWDVYSNSIARTVFNVLSGKPEKGEIKPDKNPAPVKCKEEGADGACGQVPDEFRSLLEKFAKRICAFPQFNDLCNQQINSGLLQSLMVALASQNGAGMLVERIISAVETNPLDLTDVDNSPMARLLEVVISTCDKSHMKRLYKLALKENLVDLAKSKYGNFIIQKLVANCKSQKMFFKIFPKLDEAMEEILQAGNTGVLLAVVTACRNLEVCQGGCMTMLSKAFHITDSKAIVPLVSTLTPSEKYDPDTSQVTVHGCLVIQEILNFKKPVNVVRSLLDMSEGHLVKLLCDTRGCHITDAFVASPYVGEKNRDRMFKKLQGHYLELATSKHGSRSADALWSVMGVQQKAQLADELKVYQSDLCGTVYGKNFAWKIHLDNYRRDREEWIKLQRSSVTAEKYFADILPPKKQKLS